MRTIEELIWHCTATPEGREVSVEEIDAWHRARGWRGIGYHIVVHLDGSVSSGRPPEKDGAHVRGRNRQTLGYVYVGGLDEAGEPKDTRTLAQKETMEQLTAEAIKHYGIVLVSGHRDYAAKACPCFDARAEYAHLLERLEDRLTFADPLDELAAQVEAAHQKVERDVKDYLLNQSSDQTVAFVQAQLKAKGYPEVGDADGVMGSKTRGALLAFKADAGLPLTAEIDDDTIRSLIAAGAREVSEARSNATAADLRAEGSRIVKSSDVIERSSLIATLIATLSGIVHQSGAGELLSVVASDPERLPGLIKSLSGAAGMIISNAWVAVPVLLIICVIYARRARAARVEDKRTGKTA